MDRVSGVSRKHVQPQPSTGSTTASTRASRGSQGSVAPSQGQQQMEASNGVPLNDKFSRKRTSSGENLPRPNKASTPSRQMIPRATSPIPNKNDELLKILKAEFEALRSQVTCTICYGLLYEPYTTGCGHTFCYICLCKSFSEERSRRKHCPGCRTIIKHAPAEAYLVREMTHSFTKHPQLLGRDETLDQHAALRKEHKDAILQDKNNTSHQNGGLFKGFFDYRIPPAPIRDSQDGVDRCPDCTWELEDGHCMHCNQYYGPSVGANFSGYSEDGDGSDLIQQIEAFGDIIDAGPMDYDVEFQDGEDDDDWYDQMDQFMDNFALQRYLENPGAPSHIANLRNRGRAVHSAAGSHRRSLHADATSDMVSIAEEDEDEEEYEEDEDTSMDGFIVDESGESHSQSSTSASEQTPQPHSRARSILTDERGSTPRRRGSNHSSAQTGPQVAATRSSQRRRYPRVIEDTPEPTTGTTGRVDVEEDEDEELPIHGGRRRHISQQSQIQNARSRTNASGQLGRNARWGYSPLGVDGYDAFDEDYGSDGTTVGLDPTTISNDRLRDGGSLTPTADRPHPPLRPLSRTGASTFPIGSRGLRRRSSVLSISNSHYEDGDADDDGSDVDPDGDTFMARPPLRHRSSRIHINDSNPSNLVPTSHGPTHTGEVDSEDSDVSEHPIWRGQHVRPRSQEYDPRISLLFAAHQNEMRDVGQQELGLDLQQMRAFARTPIARPRTANRNRQPIHGSAASPGTTNTGTLSRQQPVGNSPGRLRNPTIDAEPLSNVDHSEERVGFTRQVTTGTTGGGTLLPSVNTASPFAINRTIGDTIQRPPSRVNYRPGVTPTRRNPLEPPEAELLHSTYISPGLNTARVWQSQNRNPFLNTLRPRQSNQRLQNRPSTATLRGRSSGIFRNQTHQTNGNSSNAQSLQVRPQASRIHLRAQPSVQRLQPQNSTRNLRDPNPASPPAPVHGPDRVRPGTAGMVSLVDQRRRGAEGLERRQPEMAQSQSVSPTTSNPFIRIQRQGSVGASSSGASQQDNPRATTIFRPMSGTATTQVTRESPVVDIPPRQTNGVGSLGLNANSPGRRRNSRVSGMPSGL